MQPIYVIDSKLVKLEEEWTVAILSLPPADIVRVEASPWYEA